MVLVASLTAALAVWLVLANGIARRRQRNGAPAHPLAGGVGGPSRTGIRGDRQSAPGEEVLAEDDTALVLDLSAMLLQAGLPVTGVLAVLAREVPGCGALHTVVRSLDLSLPWGRAWAQVPEPLASLGDALAFSHLTGAATAALLSAAADQRRRSDIREAERRAAELGVRLVLPLGVCALPAFICLGIVPVVISLLPDLG